MGSRWPFLLMLLVVVDDVIVGVDAELDVEIDVEVDVVDLA